MNDGRITKYGESSKYWNTQEAKTKKISKAVILKIFAIKYTFEYLIGFGFVAGCIKILTLSVAFTNIVAVIREIANFNAYILVKSIV